jgi:hypothetical protein
VSTDAPSYRAALSELLAECEERGVFTEGQFAAITGLDRVAVRELLDDAHAVGPRRLHDGEDLAARERFDGYEASLRRILGGFDPVTTPQIAQELGVNPIDASRILRRSDVVIRLRPGLWTLAPSAVAPTSGGVR